MNILTISGSSRATSSNIQLLKGLENLFLEDSFVYFEIASLPLFSANDADKPSVEVLNWKKEIKNADAVLITTPEYLHNLPAAIKNALEWLAASGELVGKRVLPVTFTPNPPRGEKTMKSLLWSLEALDAQVVGSLSLYSSELKIENGQIKTDEETEEMIIAAIKLLKNT